MKNGTGGTRGKRLARPRRRKELCITTDYPDDLRNAGRHWDEASLDALMRYAASLGATRYKWMFNTDGTIYEEDSPAGFDVLKTACEAAHRHGMRFDAVFKPFEGALWHRTTILPDNLPIPEGARVMTTPMGLVHHVRAFLLDHSDMRLARRSDDEADPGGNVATIRLIHDHEEPSRFAVDELSIWTSPRNGGFTRYDGPVFLKDSLEWRPRFPESDRKCHILALTGLDLPAATRFVMIRLGKGGRAGDISNAPGALVELARADGALIPCMASARRVDAAALYERTAIESRLGLHRYLQSPEVAAIIRDRDRFLESCEGMFDFRTRSKAISLGPGRELAILRGKHRFVYGALHPGYPEVRQEWLDHIRFCLDRGVDGVNIRLASHNFGGCHDPWAYGFNAPVLAHMERPDNTAEAARVNGKAFTRFLREARDLLHARGREIGVQVYAGMLHPDRRDPDNSPLPWNFDWAWEEWIRDIADYVELRGGFTLHPAQARAVTDRIGLAARAAGIPFIYQCNRLVIRFDGPLPSLAREMDWIRHHPDVTAYDLYESAAFTRLGPDGDFQGSPDVAELARRRWP